MTYPWTKKEMFLRSQMTNYDDANSYTNNRCDKEMFEVSRSE